MGHNWPKVVGAQLFVMRLSGWWEFSVGLQAKLLYYYPKSTAHTTLYHTKEILVVVLDKPFPPSGCLALATNATLSIFFTAFRPAEAVDKRALLFLLVLLVLAF